MSINDTILSTEGNAADVMLEDAFVIHDLMFNVKEVLQCLFYSCNSLYEFYNSNLCNSFAITINKEERAIMATPMIINTYYNSRVMLNDPTNIKQIQIESKKNSYIRKFDDQYLILFLTKGFVMDHFVMREGYHDFQTDAFENSVYLKAEDIENLTIKDPNLE